MGYGGITGENRREGILWKNMLNTEAKKGLECLECGCIYNYPHYEVKEAKLVGPILPLNFCSRKCFDKYMITQEEYDKDEQKHDPVIPDCPYSAGIVEALTKSNPYPESVFTEPTPEEYILMAKVFKDNGLVPDRFFGSWGRRVWSNCANKLEGILEPEE
jgi:hypothetical protein